MPKNTSLNCTMPELVNISVGSLPGTSELEGTTVWPRAAKKSRNDWRISATVKRGVVIANSWMLSSQARDGACLVQRDRAHLCNGETTDYRFLALRCPQDAKQAMCKTHIIAPSCCIWSLLGRRFVCARPSAAQAQSVNRHRHRRSPFWSRAACGCSSMVGFHLPREITIAAQKLHKNLHQCVHQARRKSKKVSSDGFRFWNPAWQALANAA